jgi:hypothetical protein
MSDIPRFIQKEVHLKDDNQLQIDVIEIAKLGLLNIERVYFLTSHQHSHVSGNHAHLNQSQIFMLVKGSAQLQLTNSDTKQYEFKLEKRGLFVPEAHWIELTLAPDSIVLCLASKSFDQLISINNIEEFFALKK